MADERDAEGVTKIGEPLRFYDRGEQAWPALWRMPETGDDADLFDKMAHITDDICLRQAVHVWDNCMQIPQAFPGVAEGLLSAHARLVVGFGVIDDLEAAADAVRSAWLGIARQCVIVREGGWDALPLHAQPDGEAD